MKIGIITFHRADNAGAVLQAYALQTYISSKFMLPTEIVDYRSAYIEQTRFAKLENKKLKTVCKWLLMCGYYAIKRHLFDRFRNQHLKLSKQVYFKETIARSNEAYDVFVAGSDQVWNLGCSGNDETYFLDFVAAGKKIWSYAASLGTYRYDEKESIRLLPLLQRFDGISVREASAITELKKMEIKTASVHLDPVFLLSKEQWEQVMSNRLFLQKYIFVYLIQPDVNVMKAAMEYAEKNHCVIISNKKSLEFMTHCSPADFVSWIYHAECVFTNSFHGTAFSLIFQKLLAADVELLNGGINNRIMDLLIAVDATQCILNKETNQTDRIEDLEKLCNQQKIAAEYLERILR